ncbi:MAG: lipoprotein [Corticimicrobacter sp.]
MLLVLGGITGCGYKGPLTRPALAEAAPAIMVDTLPHIARHEHAA